MIVNLRPTARASPDRPGRRTTPPLNVRYDPGDVADIRTRIGVEDHEVGGLPRFDRAEVLLLPDHPRRVDRCGAQRVVRLQARLDEQLELNLRRRADEDADEPGVRAEDDWNAGVEDGLDVGALYREMLLRERGVGEERFEQRDARGTAERSIEPRRLQPGLVPVRCLAASPCRHISHILVQRHRRDIAGAVALHQREELLVHRLVDDAVHQAVAPGAQHLFRSPRASGHARRPSAPADALPERRAQHVRLHHRDASLRAPAQIVALES